MLNLKKYQMLWVLLFAVQGLLSAGEANIGKLTEITSDRLEMENKEDGNYFRFYDNVKILGENLSVACTYLEVISEGSAKNKIVPTPAEPASETIGAPQMSSIMKIIAKGQVRIEQAGRVATCGLAEIFPREGKLVLTESPALTDSNGRVEGFRIVLFKDERRAIIDPYPQGGRTKVLLPTMPDLGFKNSDKKNSVPVINKDKLIENSNSNDRTEKLEATPQSHSNEKNTPAEKPSGNNPISSSLFIEQPNIIEQQPVVTTKLKATASPAHAPISRSIIKLNSRR